MNTILRAVVGSHAFGIATPDSDKDMMEVFIADYSHYMGIRKETTSCQKIKDGNDTTQYELQVFLKLCLDGNPNVLPMLWLLKVAPVKHQAWYAEKLHAYRNYFLSQKCITKFLGYGYSQLAKIDNSVTGKLGEKRKALVNQFGFDTKAASHALRLSAMAGELANNGFMWVDRRGIDAKELIAIRNGEVSLAEIKTKVIDLLAYAKAQTPRSPLPEEPDYQKINSVCIDLLDTAFGNNQGLYSSP